MESEIPEWRQEFEEAERTVRERAEEIGGRAVAELLADSSLTQGDRSMTYTQLAEFFNQRARTEGRPY